MMPIKEIYPLIHEPKKVVITMHQKPDPDAMGSSLAIYHFLKQFGHELQVISPTNWADFLKWMPGCEKVLDFENPKDREKVDAALKSADWLFCLDFNTLNRTRHMAGMLRSLKCTKILIDHHQQPEVQEFDYGISNPEKSSTSEMVYDVIVESGNEDKIDLDVAQCLYAGVMGDTGSFRFPSTTDSVHKMIASLKSTGLQHTLIHEAVYDNFLENRLRFIGHVLVNRLQVLYEYNTALIAIPWKDLVKYDIKTGDTEGLVNYPLSIQGIKLAALIIDRNEEVKLSFRSKGNFDVNTFARKYFDGGGHFNAAGGRSTETLESAVQKFIQSVKENKSQLQLQKKRMKKVLIPAIAALLLASCSNSYHKTQSGLLYKIASKGKNPQVKKGEFLKINYIQKVHDSVVVSSYETGLPAYAKVDSIGPIYSLLEVLPFLHKGDSVIIVEIGDSLEKKGMLPPYMKHTDKRQWTMKVENVFENDEAMRQDQQGIMQQYQAKQKSVFENYMKGKKDKLQETPGGVYVEMKEAGNGPAADSGKIISVRYKGKFMPSEKVFETNMDDPNKQPIQFPLGVGGVIRGWDEALRLFHQGGKGTLYVPYQMAYNDQPGPGGLPYQNLIFDIEVLDVRNAPPMQQQQPNLQQPMPGKADTTRKRK